MKTSFARQLLHVLLALLLVINPLLGSFYPLIPAPISAASIPVSSTTVESESGDNTVSITDAAFVPSVMTINVGESVTWTNNGSVSHQVKSSTQPGMVIYLPLVSRNAVASNRDASPPPEFPPFSSPKMASVGGDWDSGVLNPSQSFSHTFDSAGTYDYYDPLHPELTGRVVVVSAENAPPVVTITSPAEGAVVGGGSIQVTGTVTDDSEVVSVLVNEASATLNGNAFSATISLGKGNQVINVAAEDDEGAVGLASRVVSLDGDGPMIEINAPADGQSVYTRQPTIEISYSDFDGSVNSGSLSASLVNQSGTTTDITSDLSVTASGAQGTVSTPLVEDKVYTLNISLADNLGNVSTATIAFYVPLNAENITPPEESEDAGWISGYIYDSSTCNEHLTACDGLAGVEVTLESVDTVLLAQVRESRKQENERRWLTNRQAFTPLPPLAKEDTNFTTALDGTIVTGPDGFFAFPISETGTYWLRAEKEGYTYGQREAEVVLERSSATNAIYVTPLDPAVTSCDDTGCTHNSSDGSMQLEIPAGAIPAGEEREVSATNFEQVEFLPSGDLPEGTWETYAFNLGGDSEMTFEQPVTVRQKNEHGFAPGTSVPLGYWNQATQDWEHAGTGVVDATGEWIEMQVTHFSNYDCNDPIAEPTVGPDVDVQTQNPSPNAACETGCFINVKSGTLEEWIDLPATNVMGESVAPQLRYNTERANPSAVIDVKLDLEQIGSEIGDNIGWELYIEGQKTDSFTFEADLDESGEVGRFRYLWDGRNAQGQLLPPGVYEYEVKLSIPYRGQYCYALDGIFGNPPDCEFGATGIFVDATEEVSVEGTVELNSQPDSPYGAGWVLNGQQRLYEDEAGRIVVTNGDQSDEFYFPWKNFLSQNGMTSVLAWVNWGSGTLHTIPEGLAREWKEIDIDIEYTPNDIVLSPDGVFAYVTNWTEMYGGSLSVVNLESLQQVATIDVGNSPRGIALSPDGMFAYVTDLSDNSLSVVNLESQQQVATIGVGTYPWDIALSADGTYAYVTNNDDDNLSVVNLESQQQVATIGVGDSPYHIALSPDGTFAYVTNSNDSNVSVVDLNSQQQVATIAVQSSPHDIALSPDGTYAYVTSWTNGMSVVDLESQQQVATINVGWGYYSGITLSPDGAYAYVTYESGSVSVVDLESQQEVATFGVGYNPRSIALSSDGAFAYVTNYEDNSLSVVDLESHQQQVVTIDVEYSPNDIALSPDGAYAYVTNWTEMYGGSLSVVDLENQQQVATIDVGYNPTYIALSPDGAYAYITNSTNNWPDEILVVDLESQQQVATIEVGNSPSDIVLSPDGAYAYVTNWWSDNVSVVDLVSWQEVATIGVGDGPENIALSPDGVFAYVTNMNDDNLSVVNLESQQEVATISVEDSPLGIALSPDGGFAYVADWTGDSVWVVDLESQQEVATIGVGHSPRQIVLSPDGAFAYVTNGGVSWGGDDSVSVVDLESQQQVAVIRTGRNPNGIAVGSFVPSVYSRTATDYSTLAYDTDTETYTRTYLDGTEVHFNVDGTHDYTLEPDGRKTVYTYNADGSVATMGIIPPSKETPRWTWTFSYTSGKLTSITDPANRVTSFTVNSQGNLVEATTPDEATQHFAYNAKHLLTHHTDQNGAVTTYAYDSYGRIASVTEPARAVYNPETGQTEVLEEVRTFTPSDTSYALINESPVGDPDNPAPSVPTSDELVDRVDYGRGGRSGHTNKWGSWLDETDGEGRTTTYERNEQNNITRQTLPNGDCIEYSYDRNGNVLTQEEMATAQCGLARAARDPSQVQSWTFTYEKQFNQIKSATDPLSNTTSYVYDYEEALGNAGKLIRIIYPAVEDENGQVVTPTVSFTYNAFGLLETETDVDGTVTKYIYTQGTSNEGLFAAGVTPVPGLLTQVIEDFGDNSHLNLTTIYKEFDAQGNPLTVVEPRGAVTSYTYDALGRLLSSENALGFVNKYEYDGRGNLIRLVEGYTSDGTTGRNRVTTYSYNPDDQVLKVRTEADEQVWESTHTYDINNQLATQSDNQGRTTTYSYDEADQLTAISDPLGQTTSYSYSPKGELASITYPDGRLVTFDYDERSNLTGLTPPGKPTHTFDYTLRDLVDSYTPPDVGLATHQTAYEYNALQQPTKITRPDNQQIKFAYDSATRLHQMTLPRGTYNYSYDPATSQLNAITAPDGVNLTYSYDGEVIDQMTWTGTVNGTVEMTTDSHYRITEQRVNGNNPIAFQYSTDHLLTQAGALSLTYLPQSGLLDSTTLGNVSDGLQYNPFGEPIRYTANANSTALYTVDYTYDQLARIKTQTETMGGVTNAYNYTYDASGRLTQVKQNGTSIATYSYDGNGNRLTYTGASGTTNATYDDQDRLLTYGANSYTYTPNGELQTKTNSGQSTTYDYDVLGNLMSVQLPDGTEIEYLIDGQDRRIGKKTGGTLTQGFLYQDSLNPIAELNGNGNIVSRFVYASMSNVPDIMIKNGTTYRIISDHLGSVRLVVNSQTGQIAQRIDYDAFGQITQDTNPGFQPFGFAGGLYDTDTGLVRFGARDYDAETGRWTTKDPIGFDGGDTNLYGYVGGDPVNEIDVNGLQMGKIRAAWGAVKNVSGKIVEKIQKMTPTNKDKFTTTLERTQEVKSIQETQHLNVIGSGSSEVVLALGIGTITAAGVAEAFARFVDPTPWGSVGMFFDESHKLTAARAKAEKYHKETEEFILNSICDIIKSLQENGRWKGGAIPKRCECGH